MIAHEGFTSVDSPHVPRLVHLADSDGRLIGSAGNKPMALVACIDGLWLCTAFSTLRSSALHLLNPLPEATLWTCMSALLLALDPFA